MGLDHTVLRPDGVREKNAAATKLDAIGASSCLVSAIEPVWEDRMEHSYAEADRGAPAIDIAAGRRAFLRSMGLGAAGLATLGTGLISMTGEAAAAPTDADILNFALNLEYLEAEFYLRAVFGRGLDSADVQGTGTLGGVTGGRKVPFASKAVRLYAREIANDEQAHVRFLRGALGGASVARPAINLTASFTAAARAAGLVGPTDTFDAFANENNFLLAAFIFEDVGVTAYKGAARLIENKDILEAAAGILAVEAYHAGEVRTLLYGRGFFAQAKAISDLRDAVDGSTDLDQGVGEADRANIVPTDRNGLAFSRSPGQVLNIVYLGGQGNNNGFFPKKLNGNIS